MFLSISWIQPDWVKKVINIFTETCRERRRKISCQFGVREISAYSGVSVFFASESAGFKAQFIRHFSLCCCVTDASLLCRSHWDVEKLLEIFLVKAALVIKSEDAVFSVGIFGAELESLECSGGLLECFQRADLIFFSLTFEGF